jgi:hypothetical protein
VASCCSIYTSTIRSRIMHSVKLIKLFSNKLWLFFFFFWGSDPIDTREKFRKTQICYFFWKCSPNFLYYKIEQKKHPALFISSGGVHNGKVCSWGTVAISIEINQSLCDLKHPLLLLCILPKVCECCRASQELDSVLFVFCPSKFDIALTKELGKYGRILFYFIF